MSKLSFNHIAGIALTAAVISSTANAGKLGLWDAEGWTDITTAPTSGNPEDWVSGSGYVDPGYGGQSFDAEYLLYKYDNATNTLSIGLQTGFNIVDGHQVYSGKNYWTGDIALSFNGATLGDSSSYEYAIDFGLGQCGWSKRGNSTCGINNSQGLNDTAGIYQVTSWNNDIYFDGNPIGQANSSPFAMQNGTEVVNALTSNNSGNGTVDGQLSYFRQVSIDLDLLGITDLSEIDVHWTMSCGNDAVNGSASVPEPSAFGLFSLSLLGMGLLRVRAKK